jgi:hypothetical protein
MPATPDVFSKKSRPPQTRRVATQDAACADLRRQRRIRAWCAACSAWAWHTRLSSGGCIAIPATTSSWAVRMRAGRASVELGEYMLRPSSARLAVSADPRYRACAAFNRSLRFSVACAASSVFAGQLRPRDE